MSYCNSQQRDLAHVIDGFSIRQERKCLMHDQRSLESILQLQTRAVRIPGYAPCGIAQCTGEMILTGGLEYPESLFARLTFKSNPLIEAERAVSLVVSVTLNVEMTPLAEKQFELAISLAMTAEPILRSELRRFLFRLRRNADD